MKTKGWYQVDNLANIFLATVSTRDTRSLRISCTLKEQIIPEVLQESLEETLTLLPQFNVLIHRGFFWHYIETAGKIPKIREEYRRICPMLYEKGNYSDPHYEVTYYKNRINLDLFHALSDGTGAIEFTNFLVYNYLKRLHPETVNDSVVPRLIPETAKTEDSYKQFYGKDSEAPETAARAYHPKSLKLPYDQLQFFEVHMPADEIIRRARKTGVSVTSFIGAAIIMAMIHDMTHPAAGSPIVLTLPVNLRNYYPSRSLRNFFNNIAVSYQPTGKETLEAVAREFDKTMKAQLAHKNISAHMNHFQKLQQNPIIRMVPLFLKQPALKFAARLDNRHVSSVLSNLGSIVIPDAIGDYVDYYSMFCSSQNLFFCSNSFRNKLVITITNPYISTKVIREFVREFSKEDIPIRLYSSEVVK